MTTAHAIEVAGLRKAFGDHTVLDGLDLTVRTGSVFALLGPNGSGKTTTVRMLTTLLPADAGTVRVAGFDVRRQPDDVRARIGVTGQFSAVDVLMTGRENLRLMADLNHLAPAAGRERVESLLTQFDLTEAADRAASTYSGGMKRRLDLAMTLVGRPEVVFLDEPTTGLDPRSRRQLWGIVHDLVADGATIFLTTQYLEEADELAGHIAVLDRGHIVAEGTPAELKSRAPGAHLLVEFADEKAIAAAARAFPDAAREPGTRTLQIPSRADVGAIRSALDRLDDDTVTGFTVHTPDLDDVFLALTGHGAEVDTSTEKELIP